MRSYPGVSVRSVLLTLCLFPTLALAHQWEHHIISDEQLHRRAMAIGDLERDGYNKLYTRGSDLTTLVSFAWDGTTYVPTVIFDVGDQWINAMVFADADGDREEELYILTGYQPAELWQLCYMDDTYQCSCLGVLEDLGVHQLIAGDTFGDSLDDLYVLYGRRIASFSLSDEGWSRFDIQLASETCNRHIALGDVDGDGWQEFYTAYAPQPDYWAVYKTYWDGSAWQQEEAFDMFDIFGAHADRNDWFNTHDAVVADLDDDTRPELYFVEEGWHFEWDRDYMSTEYNIHMARFTEGVWELHPYLWLIGWETEWWPEGRECRTVQDTAAGRSEQGAGYKWLYVARYDGKDNIFGHCWEEHQCMYDWWFAGSIRRFHFDSTFTQEVVHDFGEVDNEYMQIVQLKSGVLNHERESVIVCYQKADSLILWEELSDSDFPWQSIHDSPKAISPVTDLVRISPNPVRADAEIRFTAGRDGTVALRICDTSGRTVRRLLRDHLEQGIHRVTWDGRDALGHDVPAGAYWVWALRPDGSVTGDRLLLLR